VIRYLLDTNVLSELRRNKPHGAVLAWLKGLREDQIFLSAVCLGEIQAGIERVRRHDPRKADEIEAWLERVAVSYQILPMDGPCFREWGRLMNKKTGGTHGRRDDRRHRPGSRLDDRLPKRSRLCDSGCDSSEPVSGRVNSSQFSHIFPPSDCLYSISLPNATFW
jgi:predicted nucleic acid-binding protein